MDHQKEGCNGCCHSEKGCCHSEKTKKLCAFLCKFQRNLKGPPILRQKCVDQNYLRHGSTS